MPRCEGGRDAKQPKRQSDSDTEPERVTYEKWFAVAVGQMGLRPNDFNALTPAEFIYAWIGWSELEQNCTKQAWERERWSVWVATCIQLDKKDRQPMTQMFPLPWEEVAMLPQELTMKERKERIDEMLNRK